jgi:hypothetical protein
MSRRYSKTMAEGIKVHKIAGRQIHLAGVRSAGAWYTYGRAASRTRQEDGNNGR